MQTSHYDLLEEFVLDVERSGGTGPNGVNREGEMVGAADDVYVQLARKDNDLFLAAQVGKALLEKNEQLQRENERLADDYSNKLEQLEQEKHALRRKLDNIEGEYDARVAELQSDLALLQRELQTRQQSVKYSERERLSVVNELSEQNQRLADQLVKATNAEDQLANQLNHLRDRFNTRRSNMSGHVSQLEMLREEFNLIAEKKADLEKTIQSLADERESISLSLEESTDRIILLEKQAGEQELRIRSQERDLEELRQVNGHLQERVEILSRRSSTPASLQAHTSLLNEIEMSEDDVVSNGAHTLLRDIPYEDIEEDDDDDSCGPSPLVGILRSSQMDGDELRKLKEEVLDAYVQVRNLCMQMRYRRGSSSTLSSSSSDEIGVADVRVGLLSDVLKQLRGQLHDILRREAKGACGTCGRGASDREDLERDLNFVREELSRVQRKLEQKVEDGRRKGEEIINLNSKLNIQQIELQHLAEERDLLGQNLSDSNLSRDEVVQKSWQVRDQAIARKNVVEIELARTRIDVMNVNSQLLEAIQQKLELSQQLEQWQVDMQALLDDQMQRKLVQDEKSRSDDSDYGSGNATVAGAPAAKPKLFGLWR